jgi:hypothetical protein
MQTAKIGTRRYGRKQIRDEASSNFRKHGRKEGMKVG